MSKGGLEGVVASDSAIGKIKGSDGELRYRGYLIKDLADHSSFVETAFLLWHGELPSTSELEALHEELRVARALSSDLVDVLRVVAKTHLPMDALRTLVSAAGTGHFDGEMSHPEEVLKHAIRLTAYLPTMTAAYDRLRKGLEPLPPRDDLSHAANFLYMLTGEEPEQEIESMLDTCLILHAEHGFNASTFSGRVTAATLSDIYSAVTSAIGTLKGPLHGGANTAVMNMLLEINSVEAVEPRLDEMLASKQKIMGFGHRVYKVIDPRAVILKEFSRRMSEIKGESLWYDMSTKLETLMTERKGIDMNVDFYSASTYYSMGIDPDLFTTIFAISRVAGWTAHVMEQYGNNRLIRPRSNWVGAEPRDYLAMDQRSG